MDVKTYIKKDDLIKAMKTADKVFISSHLGPTMIAAVITKKEALEMITATDFEEISSDYFSITEFGSLFIGASY